MKFVLIAVLVLGVVWYLSRRGSRGRAAPPELPPRPSSVTAVNPGKPATPAAAQGTRPAARPGAPVRTEVRGAQAQREQAQREQVQREQVQGRPSSVRVVPPGTRGLDDPDAVRPDIDARALASARAAVTPAVPDAVLSDALLDASPEQLGRLLASVPTEVMTQALGRHGNSQDSVRSLRAEDRQQLSGLGDALDDLDIWNFGDDTGRKA